MRRAETLLCVGGPWHGQKKRLGYGESLMTQLAPLEPAYMHDPKVMSPEARTVLHVGVYRREKVAFHGEGYEVQMEVLAYYGKDTSERPQGWHL